MEQPEKLPSADEVKATLSPHMQSVWDAAAKCLDAPTDENLAEFKKLCRPAEIMLLLLYYADSVISETNVKGDAAARWTLVQLRGFSPSHPPACCAFVGCVKALVAEVLERAELGNRHTACYALSPDLQCRNCPGREP